MRGEYQDCDEVDDVLIHFNGRWRTALCSLLTLNCIGIDTSSVQEEDYVIHVLRKSEIVSFLLRDVSGLVSWKKAVELRCFLPRHLELVGWCKSWEPVSRLDSSEEERGSLP